MSYFQTRIDELGITPENNKIRLHSEGRFGTVQDVDVPIFSSTPDDDIR